MGGGCQEIDAKGLYIHIQCTQCLYSIDTTVNASLMTVAGNHGNIIAKACRKLNQTETHKASVFGDTLKNVLNQDTAIACRHQLYLHAVFSQVQPRIDIARKLTLRSNDGIAFLPVQTLCNQHQPITSARRHCDLVRPCTNHTCQSSKGTALMLRPALIVNIAICTCIVNIGMQRLRHWSGQWPISGMVQIDSVARNREKEVPQFLHAFFLACKFMFTFLNN